VVIPVGISKRREVLRR